MNSQVTAINKISAPTQSGKLFSRFKKSSISHYPLPGKEMLSLNKVQWPIDISEAALVIHDMQVFWNDFFENSTDIVTNISKLKHCFTALGTTKAFI
jgi:hypothetical protein